MNQQEFAAIFASVMSTYFGVLILMYIVRTSLVWFVNQATSALPQLQPTIFHNEVKA